MPFRGIHKKHSDTLNSKYSFRFYRFFKELCRSQSAHSAIVSLEEFLQFFNQESADVTHFFIVTAINEVYITRRHSFRLSQFTDIAEQVNLAPVLIIHKPCQQLFLPLLHDDDYICAPQCQFLPVSFQSSSARRLKFSHIGCSHFHIVQG